MAPRLSWARRACAHPRELNASCPPEHGTRSSVLVSCITVSDAQGRLVPLTKGGPLTWTTVLNGNLVKDPELRPTSSGQAIASSWAADARPGRDATRERREAWRELGRHVARSLHKGGHVTGDRPGRTAQLRRRTRRKALELTAPDRAAGMRGATVTLTRGDRRDLTRGAVERLSECA